MHTIKPSVVFITSYFAIRSSLGLLVLVLMMNKNESKCEQEIWSTNGSLKSATATSSGKRNVEPILTRRTNIVVHVACFLDTCLCVGFAVGLGVIFVKILEVFQSSYAQTSLLLSLCIGMIFSGSMLARPIVQKLKPGNSMILGGILGSVGCIGATFATNVNTLIACIGVITGFGLCLAHFSAYVIINAVVTEGRGFGVSLMIVGAGIGSISTPLFNAKMLNFYGWRGTFLILAGILFHLTLIGFLLRCLTKEIFRKQAPDVDDTQTTESCIQRLHLNIFSNFRYTIYSVLHLPVFMLFGGQYLFMVALATEKGFTLQDSSFLLSANALAGLLGNFVGGILNTKFNISGVMSGGVAIIMGGACGMGFVLVSSYPWMLTGAISMGVCFGVITVTCPISVLELCGDKKYYPTALAYTFGIGGLGDLISGPVGGLLRDLTGSYLLSYYIACAAGLGIGLIYCVLSFCTGKRKENTEWISTETITTSL